jgi:LEA14-like dessication related protein
MYKKIAFILFILFIINIIVTALLFNTVNSIETPDVTIEIKIAGVTEDTITLEATFQVDNPNSFSIMLKDMIINATTPDGEIIGLIALPNMTIDAGKNATISSINTLGFNGKELTTFYSKITGNVGVTLFGFFTKTLPINVLLITNPTSLVEAVQVPGIQFDAEFSDFTADGVLFNGTIWVDNQNDFSMQLKNIDINVEHTNALQVAELTVLDTQIPPRSKVPILVNGTAYYSIFNEGTLSATISADASIILGGVDMSLPFSSKASMTVPDLSTFLLNGEHLIISLSADFDLTLHGINTTVGFRLYNPTEIPMTAYNLTLTIYRLDNETPTVLAEDTLEKCPFAPENETCLKSAFILAYSSFIPQLGTGFPDWFQLSLTGDFTIANTTQRIPVTLNGYISPKIIDFN